MVICYTIIYLCIYIFVYCTNVFIIYTLLSMLIFVNVVYFLLLPDLPCCFVVYYNFLPVFFDDNLMPIFFLFS